MSYLGDIALEKTFDTKFTSVAATGAPTVLAGSPVISAYLDNNTTQLTAGITLTVDFDGVVGLNNVRVVATAANGYAAGVNYQLVITTGTVGGVSVVGYVVAEFSIQARSALRPTVADRTADVSAGGEVGLDWANIGSPTTAQNLSSTNIDPDQVVASVTGAVGSVTGNVGGNVVGSVASVTAGVNVTQLGGSTQSATDLKDFADDGYDPATNKVQGVVLVDTLTTYTGDTPQTGDSFARLGAPAGASMSADIAAIEAQTDDIGAAGAGLTAIPWNAAWDAEVESEANDALVAQNLDHLVKIAVDTDFPTTVHLNSVVGHLADNGTAATFDRTTDSLEALQGVSAPSAAVIADAIWDETLADHLGAGSTGAGLNAAGSAGDPWSTALPGAYGAGSAGKIIGDNVNATISSRATPAQVNTEVDTALADARLDELLAADSDIDGAAPPTVGSVFHELLTKTAGSFTFDQSTDSLEALRDNLSTASALALAQTDIDDIQGRLPAALVGGRMDSNMQAAANGVITAAVIATDAFDSDAIAANAITEIQNGLATSAALTTLTNYVDTEIGTLQTDVSAILADTGTDGVVVAVASKTGYALSAAGIDEIFDELRAGHSVAGSYGESFFTLESGAAIAGTLSTTQMSTNLTEATDDHFKGRIVIFTSGALLRQATDITAYNGTTKVLTFTALTEAPTAADKFVIV